MTIWFTSDTHYGHRRVIEYAGRPFTDVDMMNNEMIRRWDERVKPGDLVYHLGDFALCEAGTATTIAKSLRGQKYIVWGNHDKGLRKDAKFVGQWIWNRDLTQIEVEGQKIILCHYAMKTWNQMHRGSWQLYGHSHGSLPDDPASLQLDVGVDCWDYAPVSFEQIKQRMAQKKFVPVDHHGE